MKVLVLGANGFFGRSVVSVLGQDHTVYKAGRDTSSEYRVDLTVKTDIAGILRQVKPEVIINCAGVVDNSDKANLNPVLTSNLLEEVVASGLHLKSIIISGSAAEYGLVDKKDLPVKETSPLNANNIYGLSKLKEVAVALDFREKYHLPIVIVRIFNPLGVGMGPRFLTSRVMEQIKEIRAGSRTSIEVSRLDAKRDCLDIQDAAMAVKLLIEGAPKESVYNIGSGHGTSNGELVDMMLKYSHLPRKPEVVETSPNPEPLVAIQADITRIHEEFGWSPSRKLEKTVEELVNAAK